MSRRSGPEDAEAVDLAAPDGPSPSGDARRGRSLRSTVLALGLVVGLIAAGAFIATRDSGSDRDTESLDTFAPDVTVGDASFVVLATTFDELGARHLIPGSVVTALGAVPGVKASEGVLRSFVPLQDLQGRTLGHGRTTLALSWNGTAGLDLSEGRPPVQAGEVALDVGTLDEHDLHVGDQILTPSADVSSNTVTTVVGNGTVPQGPTATIVGAFSVAGGEAGVPGVALSAFDAGTLLAMQRGAAVGFDRVDLIADADADADPAALLDRLTAALPSGLQVVPATQLGTREQLRAELEIQRAFFDLLSLDELTRNAAVEGADQATPEARARGNATFTRYLGQLVNVEFRVQRVSFLDADHASLVFMTYYGSSPSPVLIEPFAAHAVRADGRWKVSSSTVCTLTLLGGAPCIPQPGRVVEPPPGWQLPSALPEVVAAFEQFVAADPSASTSTIVISGVRPVDADHAEAFYTITDPAHPEHETPYPLVGTAVREGGAWKVDMTDACGVLGLAQRGCAP